MVNNNENLIMSSVPEVVCVVKVVNIVGSRFTDVGASWLSISQSFNHREKLDCAVQLPNFRYINIVHGGTLLMVRAQGLRQARERVKFGRRCWSEEGNTLLVRYSLNCY